MIRLLASLAIAPLLSACVSMPPAVSNGAQFTVTPVAEMQVASLPDGQLFWFVEQFADRAAAERGAGATALIADDRHGSWRFTIGRREDVVITGDLIATIGPVPVIPAERYLLRVNRAGGPPGVRTAVHSHPGSEAFVVRSGRLCQRMGHGTTCVDAGGMHNGHGADQAMQLWSAGDESLDQFVLFVVDADRPFSSPARFR